MPTAEDSTLNPETVADPQASDVDALAPPEPAEILIGGERFAITPMKVRQVFPFLKTARPLFDALVSRKPSAALPPAEGQAAQGVGASPEPLEIEAAMNDAKWVLDMLSDHGEAAISALSIGCDIPQDKLENLEVVGLVTLLKHFVKVNAGFFVAQGLSLPQLAPASLGAVGQVAKRGKR